MNTITELGDYPVMPATLNSFAQKILAAARTNQPVAFDFDPRMGGARAWVKFLLKNPRHTDFTKRLDSSQIIIFEPDECIESSNLAFFYLLLEKLNPKPIKKYEDYSLKEVVAEIKNIVKSTKTKFVTFLVKLDSFDELNPIIGNLLYSIWKDSKDKITFVTTLSQGLGKSELQSKLALFSECVLTNYHKIDTLSKGDILQSINHWGKKLEFDFNEKEINAIIKYSDGKSLISKILCQEIAKSRHAPNPDLLCKNIKSLLFIGKGEGRLTLSESNSSIFLKDKNISSLLSYQEFSTLKLLVEKQGLVANRDDIADALWGDKSLEKYSDWAIDKFISLVRLKLKKLNFAGEIKAKKGEGFMLIQ